MSAAVGALRAIETEYRGHRFRSRLEARWAVFFGVAGIQYEYEPEGFELTSGRYLPDFLLPEQGIWFEAKPMPSAADPAPPLDRHEELARVSGKPVYVVCGMPWYPWEEKDSYFAFALWPSGQLSQCLYQWWCSCSFCGAAGMRPLGRADMLPCACNEPGSHTPGFAAERLLRAYEAARAARFDARGRA